jgi:O-antigen/teichoic acid export membrane protein
MRAVGLASLAICALGIGLTLIVTRIQGEPALAILVTLGLTLVPLIAMRQIYRSSMQGIQRPLLGFVPELFVHPFAMLLLAATAIVAMHRPLSALHAVGLQVTAGVLSLVVGHLLLKHALPREILDVPPRTEYRSWLRGATPFLLAQLAFMANEKLSVLVLGMAAELSQVGVFAVASSLAMFVSLPLNTVNAVIAGRVAHLYAGGKKLELQQLLISVVLLCVLVTLPVVLAECLFGDHLLGMFGEEFVSGYTTLRILVLAQFFNVASGSVGVVLNMSGHARDVVVRTVISTGLGLACSICLIPYFGIAGAAVAQGVGVVVFNSLLVIKAHQRLGINPTIFAIFRREVAL